MDMEIINTVYKCNKNVCLNSQEVKSVGSCTTIFVTSPRIIFEDLT